MALLGFLSLAGMLIKNEIVLLDQVNIERAQGKPAYPALIDASASRVRPVCMAAFTTVLGMVPLIWDPFFAPMAVTIMVRPDIRHPADPGGDARTVRAVFPRTAEIGNPANINPTKWPNRPNPAEEDSALLLTDDMVGKLRVEGKRNRGAFPYGFAQARRWSSCATKAYVLTDCRQLPRQNQPGDGRDCGGKGHPVLRVIPVERYDDIFRAQSSKARAAVPVRCRRPVYQDERTCSGPPPYSAAKIFFMPTKSAMNVVAETVKNVQSRSALFDQPPCGSRRPGSASVRASTKSWVTMKKVTRVPDAVPSDWRARLRGTRVQ